MFPRFWRQVGGHLRLVEGNSLGVVWGVGYDHTAWVYTGGYGGGIFQGTTTLPTTLRVSGYIQEYLVQNTV